MPVFRLISENASSALMISSGEILFTNFVFGLQEIKNKEEKIKTGKIKFIFFNSIGFFNLEKRRKYFSIPSP